GDWSVTGVQTCAFRSERVTAPVRVLKLETPPTLACTAACTKAVVANWLVLVPGAAVGALGRPEKAGEARGAPPALVTSVRPRVTAPIRPLKLVTLLGCREVIALVTNCVVASCVVLVPATAVGAAGTPVKVGLAIGAPPAPVMSAVVSVTTPWRALKEVTVLDCKAATALVT